MLSWPNPTSNATLSTVSPLPIVLTFISMGLSQWFLMVLPELPLIQKKATLFNSYFYSVFTVSDSASPLPGTPSAKAPCLNRIQFDIADVYEVMASLDPVKAMGIDGLGPGVL